VLALVGSTGPPATTPSVVETGEEPSVVGSEVDVVLAVVDVVDVAALEAVEAAPAGVVEGRRVVERVLDDGVGAGLEDEDVDGLGVVVLMAGGGAAAGGPPQPHPSTDPGAGS
jgi:hypothetical protein